MLCSEHSSVNANSAAGVAVSLRCKCWHCEICQPINRGRVIALAKRGDPTTFLTLTLRHAEGDEPEKLARRLTEGWRKLRRWLATKNGGKQPPFIAVFEAHKSGAPHLHLLLRMAYVQQQKIHAKWQEIVGSGGVNIKAADNGGRATAYVAKYIGKDLHRFAGCKRFWRSQDYAPDREFQAERPALPGDRWWKENRPLHELVKHLQSIGQPFEWRGHRLMWGDGCTCEAQ